MPTFRPFRGERYAPDVPLDLVVAPPYDVIDDPERAVLAARHPANAVVVELPVDPPDSGRSAPGGSTDRYAAAAEELAGWRRRGLLRREPRPALYPYRMTSSDGQCTTGVLGLLPCGDQASGVLPHEQTTPKDMADRLSLLRACRVNISPVWGLSLAAGLGDLLVQARPADAEATAEGVRHELWVLDDPAAVSAVTATVGSADVVLADGHHRFETAKTYAAERAATGLDDPGADWILALVVELSPRTLTVGPIHRALRCPGGPTAVERAASGDFDLVPLDRAGQRPDDGPVLVTATGSWRLHPKPGTVDAAVAASPAGTAPEAVIDSVLAGLLLAAVPDAAVRFDHDAERIRRDVAAGAADAGLLLRPVPVAAIGSWAQAGRLMPPKSTYFWPKPRTGMVLRPLDD